MSNKALVHLLKYGVTWKKLRTLPEEHLAAISVLAYAVSEINALQRIYLSQSHEPSGEQAIDSAANIQKFVVLRSWSSKVFEIEQFVQLGGKKPETSDQALVNLASRARVAFEELRAGEGYQVAQIIRHEATNHYSFRAAKKNLSHVPKGMDCDMYLHDMGGNSFFPVGEAEMFHARLSRRWANISSYSKRQKLFEEWLDWNLKASRWMEATQAEFTKLLVFDALEDNEFEKKTYWVSEKFVGEHQDRMTPVFLRKGD